MSANIYERKTKLCESSPNVEVIEKSLPKFFIEDHDSKKEQNVEKNLLHNHVEVKLFLFACLAVGVLLVLWLMLEFKKPIENFGGVPKVRMRCQLMVGLIIPTTGFHKINHEKCIILLSQESNNNYFSHKALHERKGESQS